MSGQPVRIDREEETIFIGRKPKRTWVKHDGLGTFFGHFSDISEASATQLGNVLSDLAQAYDGYSPVVAVSEVERSLFDSEYSPASDITFSADAKGLLIDVAFTVDDFQDEDELALGLERSLKPILARKNAIFVSTGMDERSVASPWFWHVRFRPPTRGKLVADIYRTGEEIAAFLDAMTGSGDLSHETAKNLLRAGRADLLIGQREGPRRGFGV